MKVEEEYYWAIPQVILCPNEFQVVGSLQLFQLDSLVHTSKVDLPTLNSDLLKTRLAVDLSTVR
jgi:hypothetical protein